MMKRTLVLIAAVVWNIALFPAAGRCSEAGVAVVDAAVDLAVPDSAGLTALGLGPSMVERPGSPREFSASLLHGVDTNGNVQTGMSVDVAPVLWYRGQNAALREYQERYSRRLLSRTVLSFAVAHGDSAEGAGTRFALGLRFTPWDEGDPRMDDALSDCLQDAVLGVEIDIKKGTEALQEEFDALQKQRSFIERRIEEEAGPAGGELQAVLKDMLGDMDQKMKELEKRRDELITVNFSEMNERSSAAITACRKNNDHRERLWKSSGWSFGVVPVFVSSTSTSDDLKSSGTALWTSVAFDLLDFGQLILHARSQNNEMVPDRSSPGRLVEQDSFRAGGRIRFGDPDLNFSIEGLHITEKGRNPDKKIQYGAGMEHRITEAVWFAFTIGSEEYDNGEDNLIVLANLRWVHTPPPARKF